MKKCRKCGGIFSDSNITCPDCGELLVKAEETEEPVPEAPAAARAPLPLSSKIFGGLGIAAAVIGGLLAALFVIRGNASGAALAIGAFICGFLSAVLLLHPDIASGARASRAEKKNDEKTTRFAGILLSLLSLALAAAQIMTIVLQALSEVTIN